jgi:hypothetical protein
MRRTMHLQALAVVLVAVAATLAAGCGAGSAGSGGSGQSASDFVRQVTSEFSRGQAGRLWDELHPAEQAVVTKARFVDCQKNEGFRLLKFKVLETYAEKIDVAGRSVPSTAVSVQVTSDDGVTTATLHAVRVNGTWRWVLQPSDLAAYRRGACPAG